MRSNIKTLTAIARTTILNKRSEYYKSQRRMAMSCGTLYSFRDLAVWMRITYRRSEVACSQYGSNIRLPEKRMAYKSCRDSWRQQKEQNVTLARMLHTFFIVLVVLIMLKENDVWRVRCQLQKRWESFLDCQKHYRRVMSSRLDSPRERLQLFLGVELLQEKLSFFTVL